MQPTFWYKVCKIYRNVYPRKLKLVLTVYPKQKFSSKYFFYPFFRISIIFSGKEEVLYFPRLSFLRRLFGSHRVIYERQLHIRTAAIAYTERLWIINVTAQSSLMDVHWGKCSEMPTRYCNCVNLSLKFNRIHDIEYDRQIMHVYLLFTNWIDILFIGNNLILLDTKKK